MTHSNIRQVRTGATNGSGKVAIGAFCTDVCDSTERIETSEEKALGEHRLYLETVGRTFLKAMRSDLKRQYSAGDLWVPGDSLWAVVHGDPTVTKEEAIATALWRTVAAVCSGLATSNSALSLDRKPLKSKTVFMGGNVLRELLFGKLRLYNGTALNACGRLEKHVDPNTIVAGFVIPKKHSRENDLFHGTAGAPMLDLSELKKVLREASFPQECGYDVEVEATQTVDSSFLRFKAWPERYNLQGLAKANVLFSELHLRMKKEKGIDLTYGFKRNWSRREIPLDLNGTYASFDLTELLRLSQSDFQFLNSIYKHGDIKFHISRTGVTLECFAKKDRPEIERGTKAMAVDFTKDRYCILPTHTYISSDESKILIQAFTDPTSIVLRLNKTNDQSLKPYSTYEDYLDSATPAVDFIFRY
jgi:hypothetical protein